MSCFFPDQTLAYRIESALAVQQRSFMEFVLAGERPPPMRIELCPLGGGGERGVGGHALAVYAGPGHYFTRAGGLGFGEGATAAALDQAEAFFAARGEPCRIELPPLAEPAFVTLVRDRGYAVGAFTNVYVRQPPSEDEDLQLPAGVRVERIDAADVAGSEALVDVIHRGFGGPNATRDSMWHLAYRSTSRPGVARFGAFVPEVDGPIAGGMLDVLPPEPDGPHIAMLAGTATHESYRGRGAQTAIIRARLARVREAIRRGVNCDLVIIQTRPGIASERNILRHGFRLAYTRPQVVRTVR